MPIMAMTVRKCDCGREKLRRCAPGRPEFCRFQKIHGAAAVQPAGAILNATLCNGRPTSSRPQRCLGKAPTQRKGTAGPPVRALPRGSLRENPRVEYPNTEQLLR